MHVCARRVSAYRAARGRQAPSHVGQRDGYAPSPSTLECRTPCRRVHHGCPGPFRVVDYSRARMRRRDMRERHPGAGQLAAGRSPFRKICKLRVENTYAIHEPPTKRRIERRCFGRPTPAPTRSTEQPIQIPSDSLVEHVLAGRCDVEQRAVQHSGPQSSRCRGISWPLFVVRCREHAARLLRHTYDQRHASCRAWNQLLGGYIKTHHYSSSLRIPGACRTRQMSARSRSCLPEVRVSAAAPSSMTHFLCVAVSTTTPRGDRGFPASSPSP